MNRAVGIGFVNAGRFGALCIGAFDDLPRARG